jgi:hypothetical protein
VLSKGLMMNKEQALAKDCCYKCVSVLQSDKIEMQAKITKYLDRNEKLHAKWKQQKRKW